MKSTREKILEAAEVVFMEKGFAAASVRDITQRAEVNVAAVNYHYGSKEDLILALIHKYTDALNLQRIERLAKLEASGPMCERICKLVRVIAEPMLEMVCSNAEGARAMLVLYGRIMAEGDTMRERIDMDVFGEIFRAICEAISRVLEVNEPQRVHMVAHFIVSTVVGTMLHTPRASAFSPPEYLINDSSQITENLVRYICGGIHEVLENDIS